MADISIEEARAKIWLMDVERELDAVQDVLDKVSKVLTTVVGSDDTIMQGLYKVGETMESVWGTLCKNFKEAHHNVSEAVKIVVGAAQDVVEDVEVLKGKIK